MSRRELGRVLRKLANRLDPPQPSPPWAHAITNSITTTGSPYSITWRHH